MYHKPVPLETAGAMVRPTLAELERIAQKPEHRRVGNWMARRVTRPLALRVTRLVLPWKIHAHAVTLAAWLVAGLAAAAFACGGPWFWLAGAALLHLWYLLDHVDGQLARCRGTASLDGTQLDYLMHHTVQLVLPWGVGLGLASAASNRAFVAAGLAWSLGALLLGLRHDAQYKAFVQRLKRLDGELRVTGGGGGRPAPPAPVPRSARRFARWCALKACEIHVVINVLCVLAVVRLLRPDLGLNAACAWALLMAPLALGAAAASIARSVADRQAEDEFARWFRPDPGLALRNSLGWWIVEPAQIGEVARAGGAPLSREPGSS